MVLYNARKMQSGENKSTCHVITELFMAFSVAAFCPSADDMFMDNTLAFWAVGLLGAF